MTNQEHAEFEKIRRTLLSDFRSQTLAHSGLIIAIIVGTLTLVSRWVDFFNGGAIPTLVFLFIISVMLGLTFFAVVRFFYYGLLTNEALIMTREQYDERKLWFVAGTKKEDIVFPDIALMQKFVCDSAKETRQTTDSRSTIKWMVRNLLGLSLLVIVSAYALLSSLTIFLLLH